MSITPDGFEVPLHRSLTEPILMAGAPRAVAILNGTVSAAIGLGLQMWLTGILVLVVVHTLSVFAAKRDPHFLDVLLRHIRQKGQLEC